MKIDRRPPRQGVALIPALVCLVLVGMLCALALRTTHTQRVVGIAEHRRLQAEWLAESGLARAAARLAADPSYKGETWDVPGAALIGKTNGAGVVRISVKPTEGAPKRLLVQVEADYPRQDPTTRARHRKSFTIDLPHN